MTAEKPRRSTRQRCPVLEESRSVKVFERTLAHSYEIMKLAMTEIQIHINKGKWG